MTKNNEKFLPHKRESCNWIWYANNNQTEEPYDKSLQLVYNVLETAEQKIIKGSYRA